MKFFKELSISLIGCIFMAFATSVFLLPNKLSNGGFTGVATILYYLFDFKIGSVVIILNIPVFIMAYYNCGKKFVVKTIISTIFYSKLVDFLNNRFVFTEDVLLACIFGGILDGIGTGLVLKADSSTGGTDLIVQIIRYFKSNIKSGIILSLIDIIIVLLNVIFLNNFKIGLYSFVTIYIGGKVIDTILEGIEFCKIIYIISDKAIDISFKINEYYKKGVTGIFCRGMYKNKDKLMLMCVAKRDEIYRIKKLALFEDENAFIIITEAKEVLGLGFEEII